MDTLIRVLYGPYEAHGIIKHRIQKLYGIIKYLKDNNMNYDVQPVSTFNRFTIEMAQRTVFACDIRYLKFNINYTEDTLCDRIIDAIQGNLKLISVDIPPKFPDIPSGMRWAQIMRSEYGLCEDDDRELNVPCNSLDNLESDMAGEHPSTYQNYIEGLGKEMQIAFDLESLESDNEAMPESTNSVSIKSSCSCLSSEILSFYSICYGPPTSEQWEKHDVKKEIVTEKADTDARDLNKQLNTTLDENDWDILKDPPIINVSNRSSHLGESEIKDEIEAFKTNLERIYNNDGYTDDDSGDDMSDSTDSEPANIKSRLSAHPAPLRENYTTSICNVWKERTRCKRHETTD